MKRARITIEVEIESHDGSPQDVCDLVDHFLDAGVFQDELAAFDDDHPVRVTSILTTTTERIR